jgi:hypothetical protein
MPSWRGAQLKDRDNFTFYLYLFFKDVITEKLLVIFCYCSSQLTNSDHSRVRILGGNEFRNKKFWEELTMPTFLQVLETMNCNMVKPAGIVI